MSNPSELPPDNPRGCIRNSFQYLVTLGLGYCCPWAFLRFFSDKPATLIADRLGCHPKTVRRARQGCWPGCEQRDNCMKEKLP